MSEPNAAFALGTFRGQGTLPFPGLVAGDLVYRLDAGNAFVGSGWPTMLALLDDFEAALPKLARMAGGLSTLPAASALPLDSLEVLAPVQPRQIVCAGANYRKHVVDILLDQNFIAGETPEERRRGAERILDHRAAEGHPFAFLKPVTALSGPYTDLPLPGDSVQVDWELELCIVMGKEAHRAPRAQALDYVAGFTIGNDISARDRIKRPDFPSLGMDWLACKGAPGFLPLGPLIIPRHCVPDPQTLQITLSLNGQVMQDESTADMIFPIDRLIEFVSTYMRLLPGDVICTGSPSGNGTHHNRFMQPGDVLEGRISGLGMQRVTCVPESLPEPAALHRIFKPLAIS